MNETLRTGVIGCGAIAQIMHLPYLAEYDQFEPVALADAYRPVLDAVGDHYGIAHRYTDWNDLLARDDIDAVIICHSGSHRDSIIAALDAGKHVFVEKPMTWNAREAEEVAGRAARSDRVVQVGYHKLYDPAFAYAKEQVAGMTDLAHVRVTVLHSADEFNRAPYPIRRGDGVVEQWRTALPPWDALQAAARDAFAAGPLQPLVDEVLGARRDDSRLRTGCGMMTVSIIHQIYTMFGFLGEPTRIVSAELWREGLSLHALMEYPNDVRCVLDWHYLPYLNDYREEYAFYGNHERVVLQYPGPYYRNFPSPVTVHGGEGALAWEKRIIVSYQEAFASELLAFRESIRTGVPPRTAVADAVRHMRFIQQLIDAIP